MTTTTIASTITVQEALDAWLDDIKHRCSPHTIGGYGVVSRRWLGSLEQGGRERLSDIKPSDMKAFIYVLQRDSVQPGSIRQYLLSLSAFFSHAMEEGWITEHPLANKRVKRPRVPVRIVESYTQEEIAKLLSVKPYKNACYPCPPEWNRAVIALFADTGIRAGELCGLRVEHVTLDEAGGTAKVFGKGSKERVVFFSRATADIVRAYLSARGNPTEGMLFPARYGLPMPPDNLYQHMKRLAARAGVTNFWLHKFRHYYAIRFLMNGGSLNLLQRQLGHTDPALTMKYAAIATVSAATAEAYRRFSPMANLGG